MILQSSNKPALRIGDRTVTYSGLIQKIHLFSGLINNREGRAIIYSENREAWVYAFMATWHAGMIPVPVDFLSVADDVRYILNDCKPSVIFCSAARKPVIDEVLKGSNISPEIIVLDHIESMDASHQPEEIEFNSDLTTTAVIMYTSGTTGKSKGVMLSFENLQANIDAVCSQIKVYRTEDRVLMLLPLHHILPLLGTMIMPFSVNCMIAISPSMASEDIIRTLNENKITIIIGVPRLYAAIHKGIMDKINKSVVARSLFSMARTVNSMHFSRLLFGTVHRKFGGSIRHMVSGGAALDKLVAGDYRTLGFEILEGYGLTEAAPMISFTHPGKVKVGSPGFLLPCVKAEIRDNEIVVSGPNIMQGYYGKPDETAEVLKDGWLFTGDLGYIDKKGFIFITGRKKEIIVLSNGKNINPVEIEEKLVAMTPIIKEAGVLQVGDRIIAIVVPDRQKAMELQIDDIDKYLTRNILQAYNQSVVPYKMIMQMSVSDTELPRTRLGKIQRFLLPSLITEKKEKTEVQDDIKLEEYKILKKYLEEEKNLKVQPDHNLIMDLGVDSLERVGLQVFIETSFGVPIGMEQLTSFENVLKLSEHIHEHKKHTAIEKIDWAHILRQKIHFNLPSTWFTGNIAYRLSHFFFKVYFRFKSRGASNIPKEPFIIAANHQSFLDGLLVASHLKYAQMHKTFFYVKEKHVRGSFLKFLANRNNIIIMDLNHNLKESIQKMAEVLKRKKNLIIFPEGTRTTDGTLGDFKKTFAILSRELNVPIVPVSIQGAFEAMPRGRIFPLPFRRIRVEFLQPVYPENHSYDSLSDKVRALIQYKLDLQRR
jgi:long-chain acyl-CoA synthetase